MTTAVQHIRRMRGGAQSHLMRAADQRFYVVKFLNNPQHRRVLANELFATLLARRIGLTVAPGDVVEVGQWLIENTPDLTIQLAGRTLRCEPGQQFGSEYVIDPIDGQLFDYLPDPLLDAAHVRNLGEFAGMLALDKWCCNANGRQAVFWRRVRERKYTAPFIDQGYCFNAGEWTFPDTPLRGVYARNLVYADVTGWDSFDPWLSRIESMDLAAIGECAGRVPHEWYGDTAEMDRIVETLYARRARVRELITSFRNSSRNPFPNWQDSSAVALNSLSAAGTKQ